MHSVPPMSLSGSISVLNLRVTRIHVLSVFFSCSVGSVPIGVNNIFHEMCPFRSVHRQSVQGADILIWLVAWRSW